MSQNFHNLHVHAPTQRQRERVVRAVLAYAKQAGYERIARTRGADRVIRLGGKSPWLSLEDDGYEAAALAQVVSKATKLPVLEAYCEASAIVRLGLHADGKPVGAWAREGERRPAKKHVEPLLVKGTPTELAKAFADGLIQIFPETALAVAAERFGLSVAQMFGERALRGTTIALRRKQAAWQPRDKTGDPALLVDWGSNRGWGVQHLVFEGAVCKQYLEVRSDGGPGRGLTIQLSGSAIAEGFIELLSCKSDRLELVPAGPHAWSDPKLVIPPGLVEEPDTFSMSRREAERARALAGKRSWPLHIEYRTLKEGKCELVAELASGGGRTSNSLELMVLWKPWRPSLTLGSIDDYALFAMHRSEHVSAHITLRGSLAEAWAWASRHVEAWRTAHGDGNLRIERDGEVVVHAREEAGAPPLDRVPEFMPGPTSPFQVAGATYLFGTFGYAPWAMDPRDQLVVQLMLAAYDRVNDHAPDIARLTAICDEAIRCGAAYSALLEQHQSRPNDTTRWEDITLGGNDAPLKLAAWHETHIRGIDRRIWLSAGHAARLDRARLPDYITVTELGGGVRLEMPDDRRRSELEPLIAALGALVPCAPEADRWAAERASEPQP
ncbi:hypothetical protein [Nannocystis bainbridge]|uniref:Uncharacterized protein n=1 Tax=Nannocystis bainbridge TaxID=2995303 RepID=A0ABT5E5L7_9BACT|nr:hypothetical protein [Nannocystis bainbridge]MDC0721150.1 hypothetical protein [Nannocystis bainbridge]